MPIDFDLKCKNCSHEKRFHVSFSIILEGEEIQPLKCKKCECKEFKPVYTKEYADKIYEEFIELNSKIEKKDLDISIKVGKLNAILAEKFNLLISLKKELGNVLNLLKREQLINLSGKINKDDEIHKILMGNN